jgi:hypothetical protein
VGDLTFGGRLDNGAVVTLTAVKSRLIINND